MARIARHLEICDPIAVDAGRMAAQRHPGKRPRFARELFACLIQMVEVQMDVATDPNQLAGAQPSLLRQHQLQRRCTDKVEGFSGL